MTPELTAGLQILRDYSLPIAMLIGAAWFAVRRLWPFLVAQIEEARAGQLNIEKQRSVEREAYLRVLEQHSTEHKRIIEVLEAIDASNKKVLSETTSMLRRLTDLMEEMNQ